MTHIKPSRLRTVLRDRRTLIAGLAMVYTMLFMPSVLSVQPAETPTALRMTMLISAFIYSWAFFFTLRALPRLFLLLTPVLFIASAAASYFMIQYQFEMTFQQLAVVTEVQPRTALAFVTPQLLLWMVFSGIVGYALARQCVRREIPDPRNKRVLFITSILMVCIFTLEAGTITQRFFPYNLLFAVKGVVGERVTLAYADTPPEAPITYDAKEPVTVILVIGESVRAANWGLNGYHRQTTPHLAARDGLINFTDVRSCFPLTRVAVPCILTNASMDAPADPEYSLLKLFRQIGFTSITIDMHGMSNSILGGPVSALFNDGNRLISFNSGNIRENSVDDLGVASLREVLAQHSENLFVFFHPFGSHWPFDSRYPERFRQFKPPCIPEHESLVNLARDMSECKREELINAYDNSILYADYIVDAVMESVKDRPALVLFTSDHGQSLGENGLFLHGHATAEMERKVPMVVWATPKFTARYAAPLSRLKTKRNQPTNHDMIFHTLLDCIGARGSVIDQKQSLCH